MSVCVCVCVRERDETSRMLSRWVFSHTLLCQQGAGGLQAETLVLFTIKLPPGSVFINVCVMKGKPTWSQHLTSPYLQNRGLPPFPAYIMTCAKQYHTSLRNERWLAAKMSPKIQTKTTVKLETSRQRKSPDNHEDFFHLSSSHFIS